MLKKFALLLIFLSIYLINCFSVFGSEKTFVKAENAWKKKEFFNAKTLYEQALDAGNLKWKSKDTALVKVGWIYRWIEKDPEKGLAFVNAAYKNSEGKSAFIKYYSVTNIIS